MLLSSSCTICTFKFRGPHSNKLNDSTKQNFPITLVQPIQVGELIITSAHFLEMNAFSKTLPALWGGFISLQTCCCWYLAKQLLPIISPSMRPMPFKLFGKSPSVSDTEVSRKIQGFPSDLSLCQFSPHKEQTNSFSFR